MRYTEFRDQIHKELRRRPARRIWAQLRDDLALPYERPCGSWVQRLEEEIGLSRRKGPSGSGPAYIWTV